MVTKKPQPLVTPSTEPITLVIAPEHAGERLDKVLVALLEGFSRAQVQRWIETERVTLAGKPARTNQRPQPGDVVVVRPEFSEPLSAEAQDLPIEVLFEDEHLVVVNKAPGMVVHPSPGHAKGTLVNALLAGRELAPSDEPERRGLVHRLDKDTSGVLVIAKTAQARDGLIAQFKKHDIDRRYWAIVAGRPPAQITFNTLHGRNPKDRKRFSSRVTEGREAITHLKVLEYFPAAAWVECKLETGRTHQIRVHCTEHGFAILGDQTYGRTPKDKTLRELALSMGHHALHAHTLGFKHPVTSQAMHFETPPPASFLDALTKLRSKK